VTQIAEFVTQVAAIEKDSTTLIPLESSTGISVRANNRRTSNNKTSNKNRKRTKNRTKIQNGSSGNSNKNKVIRKKKLQIYKANFTNFFYHPDTWRKKIDKFWSF